MKNALREVVKTALLFGAVGALLAVAAPLIAMGLGAAGISTFATATSYSAGAALLGHTANMAWMGAFFGSFGGLVETIKPALGWCFGKSSEASPSAAGEKPAVTINNNIQVPGHTVKFAKALQEQRAAETSAEQRR